jgi:di/tricarboxylate transporter
MGIEIFVVLILVFAAVVLFIAEKVSADVVALIIMAALMLSGILTPIEGVSGFSNPATLTVGAMFVLSAGLSRTGAINVLAAIMAKIGKRSFWITVVLLCTTIGFLSAFINNTAAMAIFLPIALGLSREIKVSPSKILMPLSFASMFGGVCTLIGTSTNILVSSIADQNGEEPFSMFELAPLGLILFAAGMLYLLLFGVRALQNRRRPEDLTESFGMGDYLTEVILLPEAAAVGKKLQDSSLVKDLDIDIVEIHRPSGTIRVPDGDTVLEANDVLRIRCEISEVKKLQEKKGIALKPDLKWRDEDLESGETTLLEAVISPNSRLVGKSLIDVDFRQTFGATVLAIRHRGQTVHQKLSKQRLLAGDSLLIEVKKDHIPRLKETAAFVVLSELGFPDFRKRKIVPAILIVAAVVATAALGILPILVGAICGSILLVLTGCISIEDAYRSVDWKVIFLLAGILPLGLALEKTGAALLLSNAIVSTMGAWGPYALVGGFYLVTTLLTETMSNNATAALLAPIAIATANTLDGDPRPLLMAVTFAASSSFMTPVGYQTNTLIYGPGQYKFKDFLLVGAPLNVLFWIISTLLIPQIWPF